MPLSVAAGPYVHLAALAAAPATGELELRLETIEPGKIFRRMLAEAPWDVAEMSLATAYMLADRGDARLAPIAVFPSRAFRHSALYVPAGSALRAPGELAGRRIGVLRYSMTTAVWVRDLLERQYGVPRAALSWVVGDESPVPVGVVPQAVAGAAALERMAVEGEIDCLVSGRAPAAFASGALRRLVPDFVGEEKAYYAAGRVFPIMHVMVARRELARVPGLLARLVARFEAAKRQAEEALHNADISAYPLPWLPAYLEDARRAMGSALWPYGVEANRATLEAFAAALAADGLTRRALAPEDVFHA